MITDDFMKAVSKKEKYYCKFLVKDTGEVIIKEIDAYKLFRKLCENNWRTAEPGMLFWDGIEQYNFMSMDKSFKIAGTNPCGEEPLPAGGSCLLGSINLSEFVCCPFTDNAYFDIDKFNDAVKTAVIGLDEVLDEGLEYHPLEEQRECVRKYRQIGLGVMGIADMLIKLGVVYGSDESLEICSVIACNMLNNALYQSAMLAKENGPFPEYKDIILKSPIFKNVDDKVMDLIKQYGLRHSALLTIPPCGSISLLLGVSGGIEPMFNISYIRKTESIHDGEVFYKVYTPIVEEYMSLFGVCKEEDLPEYFIASQEIEYENRIKMQSVWQKYIDASISSTINLPNDATIDDVCDLYMKAWQYGLKGVTVYRDGCERSGVLINEDKKKKEKKEPIKVQVKDDDEDEKWAESKLVKRNKPQNEGETPSEDKMICPNCNEKLSFTGGCGICLNCGWSKCQ